MLSKHLANSLLAINLKYESDLNLGERKFT